MSTPDTYAPDVRAEAERLAHAAAEGRLPARLMGGLAIWLRCPTVRAAPYARDYRDLDLVALGRGRRQVETFLQGSGYVGERLFNAIHGAQRMVFAAAAGYSVDVIFDEMRMSHRIDFRNRLNSPTGTLELADLLLTKLQIWEINEKDLGDAACLLADHPLGEGRTDPEAIDLRRLRSALSVDWGLCRTTTRNLGQIADLWRRKPAADPAHDVEAQVNALLREIETVPKSLGWRARALTGERVRWYETPEEVRPQ
jgi:hypothetical protein